MVVFSNNLGVLDFVFKLNNTSFNKSLFIFGLFIFRIFRKVAVRNGFFNTFSYLFSFNILKMIQFFLKFLQTFFRHKNALFIIISSFSICHRSYLINN